LLKKEITIRRHSVPILVGLFIVGSIDLAKSSNAMNVDVKLRCDASMHTTRKTAAKYTTPFLFGTNKQISFPSMIAEDQKTFRIPQNLEKFNAAGTITTEIIKNPHKVLEKAIKGLNITETITFQVSTGPPTAELNGGGTANISFLAGRQDPVTTNAPGQKDFPNAHADFMKATYWIEVVQYKVTVPKVKIQTTLLLKPTLPPDSTAPTPVFAITTPPNGVPQTKEIMVPGIQIQSSQTVNLNFGPPIAPFLSWPHVSVATLVPTGPQPFQMPG